MKQILREALPLSVRMELRRARQGLKNILTWPKPVRKFIDTPGKFNRLLVEHSSKLQRAVSEHLKTLQKNKIRNLALGCTQLDALLLEPGDIFSFCRLVGRASYRRGYVNGLEMHEGELVGAPGGGLCQLANMIFWMALHLNLDILERFHHELDLFPDDGRTVPFGMGASVLYNYRDLRFRNSLQQPLVLRISVQAPLLLGAFYSTTPLPFKVDVIEKEHHFFRDPNGIIWRENRVAKRITYRDGGNSVEKEIAHNLGRVCYPLDEEKIEYSVSSIGTHKKSHEFRKKSQ